MADCKTYDSALQDECLTIEAPYYNAIRPTEVTFTQEAVVASVDSLGHLEFFDLEGQSLGFVDVPVSDDPSDKGHTSQYGTVRCSVGEGAICFQFPVYYWEDSYPHCDGEFDRWSRYTSRWFDVRFDCQTRQITIVQP